MGLRAWGGHSTYGFRNVCTLLNKKWVLGGDPPPPPSMDIYGKCIYTPLLKGIIKFPPPEGNFTLLTPPVPNFFYIQPPLSLKKVSRNNLKMCLKIAKVYTFFKQNSKLPHKVPGFGLFLTILRYPPSLLEQKVLPPGGKI